MASRSKLKASRKLYTEYSFGEFSYDRAQYYENLLVTKYAKRLKRADVIYDIGCGRGFLLSFLKRKLPRNRLIGVDLSPAAVKRCKEQGFECYVMNNMKLKLRSNVSDYTVSNGVIHHTPSARQSFKELVRITKPGKLISVSVYNKHFYYHYLYVLCAPIRWCYAKRSMKWLANIAFYPFYWFYFIPMFLLLDRHIISVGTGRTLYADQILTPVATFHTKKEFLRWGNEENCDMIAYRKELKWSVVSFIFKKR